MLALIDLPPECAGHAVVLLPPDPRDGLSEVAAVLGVGTAYQLIQRLLDRCEPAELNALKLTGCGAAQRRILERRRRAGAAPGVPQAWFDEAHAAESYAPDGPAPAAAVVRDDDGSPD